MKIPNRLLIPVRNDFADLSRQLVVADYVERNEDLMLAEYIRVRVEMQARGPKKKPLERQLNLQRQLMRANSNCYPWENFLSLRLFPSKQVEWASKLSNMNCEVFPPASESELKATESDLGFKIPIVYREFLKRVANGVRYRSTDKAWEFDLFPANALGKSLGGRFRKDGLRRNRPTLKYGDPTGLTPISWDQLRGELPFSSNEFRQMDGMLLIGDDLEGCYDWEQKQFLFLSPPFTGLYVYCDTFNKPIVPMNGDLPGTTIDCIDMIIRKVNVQIQFAEECQ